MINNILKPQGGRRVAVGYIGAEIKEGVKFYLTISEEVRLLWIGGRCILLSVRSIQPMEYAHMGNIDLIARIGQGLLAVAATGATVAVLQLAMLA
jgi:hypothetical protein